MNKIKLILLSLLFLPSCFAKEMVIIDPDFSFQSNGIKSAVFVGFKFDKNIKLNNNLKEKFDLSFYKELSNLDSIKVSKLSQVELDLLEKEGLASYAKDHKTDIFILGEVKNYNEFKYVDEPLNQPYSQVYLPNANSNLNNRPLRTLIKFQASVVGNFSFVNPSGKEIWKKTLEESEAVQFEETASYFTDQTEEQKIYTAVRNRLIETTTNKTIRNLLPYYIYK